MVPDDRLQRCSERGGVYSGLQRGVFPHPVGIKGAALAVLLAVFLGSEFHDGVAGRRLVFLHPLKGVFGADALIWHRRVSFLAVAILRMCEEAI